MDLSGLYKDKIMKSQGYTIIIYMCLLIPAIWACKRERQWEGQEPVKKVSTETVPIQLQYKGCFDLGEGVLSLIHI